MLNVFSYICWLSVYLPWESIYLGPLINFFFLETKNEDSGLALGKTWPAPQGPEPETWGLLYSILPIGQMGKLRFREYRTRTRIFPAPPVLKAITRESQRGQLGLKSVCAHEHTHMRTEEVPQLSPRSGYSQIVLCQLKGYQGQCSAGAKVREDS